MDWNVEAIDHTMRFGEKTGSIQLQTPVYTIPPYSERENCLFYTYNGPEMFFTKGISYQNPLFGHHADIDVGNAADLYDLGDVASSCEKAMDFDWNPIVEAVSEIAPGVAYGDYPPRMGYRLQTGTMIMLQSHHINTTAESVLVNDRFDIHLSPAEEIEYPAAPLELGNEDFSIPEGFYEYTFDCVMEEDFSLAWIAGHMHEYGAYQYIDRIRDGELTRLYGVETWLDEYYLAAPVENYLPAGQEILTGDILRVTCAWDNDSGATLEHPTEMCYSGGIIFPHDVGIHCNESENQQGNQETSNEPTTDPAQEPAEEPIEPTYNLGDIVFSEIQSDPCALLSIHDADDICQIADTQQEYLQDTTGTMIGWGEWFEIYNPTAAPISLQNLHIRNAASETIIITQDIFVPPSGYAVIGNNDNHGTNGLVSVDFMYENPAFQLSNQDEELSIWKDDLLLDHISYNLPIEQQNTGQSLSVLPQFLDHLSNDNPSSWCLATTLYGDGDYGTPGTENQSSCP